MITTDFKPSIYDDVEDVQKGDEITALTSSGSKLYNQDVCDVFDVNDGKIVCITVGGEIPMLILETVTDGKYVNAYTYVDGAFEQEGHVDTFGSKQKSAGSYKAEGWLEPYEFLKAIQ